MSQDYLQKLYQIQNNFERRLYLAAILTKELEPKGIKPIVVGGNAVSFYTNQGYETRDLDLVCNRKVEIENVLSKLGFQRTGRHYINEELVLAVEVPGMFLTGDESKISKVIIDDLNAYLIGVEDMILERMRGYVFWKSTEDRHWAKEMMFLHADKIDWEYLEKTSEKQKVYQFYKEIKGEVLNERDKLRRIQKK